MAGSNSLIGRLAFGSAGAVGLYAVLLGVLLTPSIQRFALYANKFNTLFKDDLNKGESFGFAKHQVTPFNLSTPDGETLYAWHILPLDIYSRNERAIREEKRPHGPVEDLTQTTAFKLLTSDDPSPARVVVVFHGNAGHIAQGWRTDTYRNIATQPNTHVFAVDYRGFGHSTGSPTEAGLITDGTALVTWILTVAQIPPERIIILGQSLGTAVASAVSLHFADPQSPLIPALPASLEHAPTTQRLKPTLFAGVVLAAPFSSVPALLLTYRIGGLLPILLPLRPFPRLAAALTAQVADSWRTADRLAAYYDATAAAAAAALEAPPTSGSPDRRSLGSLQLVHAVNDADIPYHQTEIICRRMFGPENCIDGSHGEAVLDVKREGHARVRFEIVEYGGHNRIITYSPVAVAVVRATEDLFE